MKRITIQEVQMLTEKVYGKTARRLYQEFVKEQKVTEQRYNLKHKNVSFEEWCDMYAVVCGLD